MQEVVLVTTAGMWTFRDPVTTGIDLNSFDVEALDGTIGRIDEAAYDLHGSFVIVDTGPWIFGRKVMFPSGLIDRIDVDTKTVWVGRTKEEIKNAPAFEEDRISSDEYRGSLNEYYGPGGRGWRENRDAH
jgi:hypothetical protein